MLRYVGLDVHKVWTQVARHLPDGSVQREKVATRPGCLKDFAETLGPSDVVALESTTNALAVARLLRQRAGRVLVSNPMKTHLIAESHIKTDKVDADVLAQLAKSGFLPTVWQPPEGVEMLRRRSAYHQALGRQITRVKNRLHAVLARHLVEPPVADLFSQKGRAFLRRIEQVPHDEKVQVELDLYLLETLEGIRAAATEELARLAHAYPEAELLMSVPGIGYTTAIGILSAIGDVGRFRSPKKLVSYFGLNPIVHQSAQRCYTGRISKQGRCRARWLMVEAAHCAVRSAGLLRAFFLRIKARKGTNVAVVAAARKLTVIIWHMLASGEPYRWAPGRTTREKISLMHYHATGVRRKGGVPKGTKRPATYGSGVRSRTLRAAADRERLQGAQEAYERLVSARERREETAAPPDST
jgi:transposase